MQKAALRIDVSMGKKLFDKVLSLPLHDLERRPNAFWLSLFRDIETVRNTLSGPSAVLLTDLPFKALALHDSIRPFWEDRHADTIEQAVSRGTKSDRYADIGTALTLFTTLAMTTVGALAIIGGEMTIGSLIAANMLSSRIIGPFNQLVGSWRSFALNSANRWRGFPRYSI